MCIFESYTVKSDCPMQENYEIFKDLEQTVALLFVLEILKKALKMKKKSTENDESTSYFQSFFFFFFFRPPNPKPEKEFP